MRMTLLRQMLAWVTFLTLMSNSYADVSGEQATYRLGVGDELEIIVFNQDDLTGTYTINGSGHIAMPLIGTVKASDCSLKCLETRIVDLLKPDYLINPRVSIQVLNYRPYYIIGEVNNPASYPYVNGITYLNAVAIAGGFTYRAKTGHVVVRRAHDPEQAEIEMKTDMPVMPGDIIRVKERFF